MWFSVKPLQDLASQIYRHYKNCVVVVLLATILQKVLITLSNNENVYNPKIQQPIYLRHVHGSDLSSSYVQLEMNDYTEMYE